MLFDYVVGISDTLGVRAMVSSAAFVDQVDVQVCSMMYKLDSCIATLVLLLVWCRRLMHDWMALVYDSGYRGTTVVLLRGESEQNTYELPSGRTSS